jgi:hypothetical protein
MNRDNNNYKTSANVNVNAIDVKKSNVRENKENERERILSGCSEKDYNSNEIEKSANVWKESNASVKE